MQTFTKIFLLLFVIINASYANDQEGYFYYYKGQKKSIKLVKKQSGLVVYTRKNGNERFKVHTVKISNNEQQNSTLGRSKILKEEVTRKEILLPVFRDSSRRLRIPTGNIIVKFNQDATSRQIDIFIQENGLTIDKILSEKRKIYTFISNPGVASIDLANKIQDKNLVESAYPNWWLKYSKK